MSKTLQGFAEFIVDTILDSKERASDGSAYDLESGWCARVERKWVQTYFGHQFDNCVVAPSKKQASAIHMAHRFLGHGLAFLYKDLAKQPVPRLQIGDILFKTQGSGGFGHVGTFVGPVRQLELSYLNKTSMVAENSSTAHGRIRGALGFRTFDQFNAGHPVTVIARLPYPVSVSTPEKLGQPENSETLHPELTLALIKNGKAVRVASAQLRGGHFHADPEELAKLILSPEVMVTEFLKNNGVTIFDQKNLLSSSGRYELYIQ